MSMYDWSGVELYWLQGMERVCQVSYRQRRYTDVDCLVTFSGDRPWSVSWCLFCHEDFKQRIWLSQRKNNKNKHKMAREMSYMENVYVSCTLLCTCTVITCCTVYVTVFPKLPDVCETAECSGFFPLWPFGAIGNLSESSVLWDSTMLFETWLRHIFMWWGPSAAQAVSSIYW